MPFVPDTTGTVFVGDAGVGAIGSTNRATVNDSTNTVSKTINFLQNPSLAGAASLYGEDIWPFRNELNQFASYSPIFTLGCLTNLELNFPLSYRTLGPAVKIIRSGGGGGPTIPSLYDLDGKREFFIEDVEIRNMVGPNPRSRHTNVTQVNFKVIEPYSMGQFFHNLRSASLVTGHNNYMEAPFLLSLAFIGYDDEGNVKSPFFSQRHIPIQIVQVDMDVSNAGAVYKVQAMPTSERALTNRTVQTKTDVRITGRTVVEMLQTGAQSLTVEMNKIGDEQQQRLNGGGDKYVIQFPNSTSSFGGVLNAVSGLASTVSSTFSGAGNKLQDLYNSLVGNQQQSPRAAERIFANRSVVSLGSFIGDKLRLEAETDINEIGRSRIARPDRPNGGMPFQLPSTAENLQNPGTVQRSRLTWDGQIPTFTFQQGSTIPGIIEEVLLSSEYARSFAQANPDAAGRLNWFRIETHTYNTGSLMGLFTGESPKVYVYRVRRYKTDGSNYSGPNISAFGRSAIKQLLTPKAYSYVYTGANKDIIKFDLKFNMMFFTGVQAARSQRQLATLLGGQIGFGPKDRDGVGRVNGSGGTVSASGTNATRDVTGNQNRQVNGGGRASDDTQISVARSMNDMMINSSNDLLEVNLEIHGDPYFISDIGIGNYLGIPSSPLLPVTIDGSMNAMDGEVNVILNFRTPIDYDQDDGFVEYPLGGFLPIAMFSGIYQVIEVKSKFVKGKFTQNLTLVRKRNSDLSIEALAGAVINRLLGGGSTAISANGTPANQMQPPGADEWIVG